MSAIGPDHERWADAAGAYVLEALPDDERAAYEAHLATCRACAEEVDELRVAAEALPASVPTLAPPPALRARVMAEVEREAALLAAAGAGADRPQAAPARPPRRRWRPFALPALVAAALLLGLVAGRLIWGGAASRTVVATLDRAQAPRASARLEIRDGRAVLVATGLPAPPRGRVYEVWTVRAGAAPRATTALFSPRRDGSATATVPGSIEGVQQVLVSAERAGGSQVPTSKPILAARTS